jgi:hypothetical protein
MNSYENIINYPHHVSAVRKQMPLISRASQFSSFAALTGYEEKIYEAQYSPGPVPEITDERIEKLNSCMKMLIDDSTDKYVNIEYCQHEEKGDRLVLFSGNIRRINKDECFIEFTDRTRIRFSDIYDIDIFSGQI